MVGWQSSGTSGNRRASIHVRGTLLSASYSSPAPFTHPCPAVLQRNTTPSALSTGFQVALGEQVLQEDARAEEEGKPGYGVHLHVWPIRSLPALAVASPCPADVSHRSPPCGSSSANDPLSGLQETHGLTALGGNCFLLPGFSVIIFAKSFLLFDSFY